MWRLESLPGFADESILRFEKVCDFGADRDMPEQDIYAEFFNPSKNGCLPVQKSVWQHRACPSMLPANVLVAECRGVTSGSKGFTLGRYQVGASWTGHPDRAPAAKSL